jgi:glyoxylase-like metal-dependent hydrolase (beta-lactamase superfamily II)
VADEESSEAMVIDAPVDCTQDIVADAANRGLRIVRVVNTHGHWDHVGDNVALTQATGGELLAPEDDAEMLANPAARLMQLPFELPPSTPDRTFKEGDVIELGRYRFRVLHTPGHTPGSSCLWEEDEDVLFSGDTLFDQGMGRTDLPGGDENQMYDSLRRLADLLPPSTRVFPGHGPDTTIEDQGWLLRLGWGV